MKAVYLAGGAKGVDWQAKVAKLLPGWPLLDPRECKSTNPSEYTEFDLGQIDKARVFLAYMDSDNPSGYGLAVELGYAYAVGNKHIIFVDAMNENDPRSRYFDMLRVMSAQVFKTLPEAAEYLIRWAR